MTIALGILARDGIVMATDSQVTETDYLKAGQQKIGGVISSCIAKPKRWLAVAGAGSLSQFQAFEQELTKDFCLSERYPYGPESPPRLILKRGSSHFTQHTFCRFLVTRRMNARRSGR